MFQILDWLYILCLLSSATFFAFILFFSCRKFKIFDRQLRVKPDFRYVKCKIRVVKVFKDHFDDIKVLARKCIDHNDPSYGVVHVRNLELIGNDDFFERLHV